MKIASLVGMLLVGLGGVRGLAESFKLVAEGAPKAEVIVSDPSSQVLDCAAKELQYALEKISGATLPVKGLADSSGITRVVIGSAENLPKEVREKMAFEGKSKDEIVIKKDGDTLYLTGPTDQAALFATYTFLEKFLGVRWLWPGKTGEYYPKSSTVVVEVTEHREAPGLRSRSLAINSPHYDHATQAWMARSRMNVLTFQPGFKRPFLDAALNQGFRIRMAGHHATLPNDLLKKNPDFIAEFGGERKMHFSKSPHLCWSNPGVQDALVEKLIGWTRTMPEMNIMTLYPVDHTQFCECSQCREMASDVSTRWQRLSAILIKRVKEVAPELEFGTLAYQSYRTVPQGFVASYDEVGYTIYNGSYRYPYSSGHEANRKPLQEMAEWKKLGANVGIRGYEMIAVVKPRVFVPLVYFITDELAYAKKHNLAGYYTEVAPYGHPVDTESAEQSWNVNRMNLYAIAKGMWNPDLTTEEIVDDFCRHAYGPAAEVMKAYYFGLESAWKNAPGDLTYFQNPAASMVDGFITPELITQSEALLKKGRAKLSGTKGDSSFDALAALSLDERMFATWREVHALRENDAMRRNAHSLKVENGVSTLPWQDAQVLPEFLDKRGEPLSVKTEVSSLWDDKNLYLRIVCHEPEGDERLARFKNQDEKVWSDDSVEIFLNRPDGGYYHLAVNSLGTRYDALSKGGMSLDLTSNPRWTALVEGGEKRWTADLIIPFEEFGLTSAEGGKVDLSLVRTRPGRVASGWPDLSYHNTGSAGQITLVSAIPPKVVIYDGGRNSDPYFVALQKRNWRASRVRKVEDGNRGFSLEGADMVVLSFGAKKPFELDPGFLSGEVLDFVRNGGVLVISAGRNLPIHQWFNSPELEVRWAGWKIAPRRNTAVLAEGDWLHSPNDLTNILNRKPTPSSSYIPLGNGWQKLAELTMRDGSVHPYLLSAKIGKGTVYLTSSNLGLGGGHEMFGNLNPENVCRLLENLLVAGK